MVPYIPYLTPFVTAIAPQLGALGLLILLAVLSGALAAVKQRAYEWRRLGDFMTNLVIPYVGGWVLVEALSYFLVPGMVPAGVDFVGKAASATVYATVFVSLMARVGGNFASIGLAGVIPTNDPPA